MRQRSFSRTRLTAACCSGYFVLGLVVSLIGASLEKFAVQVSATVPQVGGTFFFFIGSASFLTLFAAGPLMDRYGKKPVLIAGSLFSGTAMLLACLVATPAWAWAVMFMLGAGVGCFNAGINTLINDLYPDNPGWVLNLVNAVFGLGAVFLPLVAGWLFLYLDLVHLLVLTAFCSFVPGVLFAVSVLPPATEGERFKLGEAATVLRDPLVVLVGLVLFFYVGLEASFGIWGRSAIVDHWGMQTPFDQFTLAGYWASLVLGRVIAGTVFRSIPDEELVLYCSAGSCAGIAVFILAPSALAASAGFWFTGLCFGPVFPSSLGTTGTCFKQYTGTIFALVIASGVLGAVVMTPAIGAVAGVSSLMTALWLTLAAGVLLLLSQLLVRKKVKERLKLN
ncbi:MAG: MFS transporter [Candidatus Glassbacteria bacterium]|nr:MFS transporter [Candidatus Glassbacteria bacterium]